MAPFLYARWPIKRFALKNMLGTWSTERKIPLDWIAHVLRNPVLVEPDRQHPGAVRALRLEGEGGALGARVLPIRFHENWIPQYVCDPIQWDLSLVDHVKHVLERIALSAIVHKERAPCGAPPVPETRVNQVE